MLKRKKLAKKTRNTPDPKKESVLKELSSILEQAGYQVRREKLKQGHGWKVLSGSCIANSTNMVFVDRKLPVDEQIDFLVSKIGDFGISFSEEQLALLPPALQSQIDTEKQSC